MELDEIIDDMHDSVDKTYEALRGKLAQVRTGRASAAILDGIRVEYYGSLTPLNQCASVLVPEPRLIVIKPWDKSVLKDIEKAILSSDVGLTPNSDGEVIRIPIPSLTEERRKELVKTCRKYGEEYKVSVRNSRRDANEFIKELQKSGDAPEDDCRQATRKVQELTDEAVGRIDEMVGEKETEIMET
jgi:ribosome recycling factor